MLPKPKRKTSKRGHDQRSRRVWYQQVMERASGRCEYCGRYKTETNLTAHHIVYLSQGGTDDPINGAMLCWGSGCFAHDRAHGLKQPRLYMKRLSCGSIQFSEEPISTTEEQQ